MDPGAASVHTWEINFSLVHAVIIWDCLLRAVKPNPSYVFSMYSVKASFSLR